MFLKNKTHLQWTFFLSSFSPRLCRYLLNSKQYLYLDLFYLFSLKFKSHFFFKYIKSKQLGLKNIEVPCPLNPCSLSFHQEGAELRTAELLNLLYQGFSVSFKSASVWSVVVNRKYKQQDFVFFPLFSPYTPHSLYLYLLLSIQTTKQWFSWKWNWSELKGVSHFIDTVSLKKKKKTLWISEWTVLSSYRKAGSLIPADT